MEDGILTRPNECIKEEVFHLSTSGFPPSATERGIEALGACRSRVCAIFGYLFINTTSRFFG